jgi:hypothetical protein
MTASFQIEPTPTPERPSHLALVEAGAPVRAQPSLAPLAELRAQLDALVAPPAVTERRDGCPNTSCVHGTNPCAACRESYFGRLKQAELDQEQFGRHAISDVRLLLPVVEALLASGGEAALEALHAGLESRRARLGAFPLHAR